MRVYVTLFTPKLMHMPQIPHRKKTLWLLLLMLRHLCYNVDAMIDRFDNAEQ